MVHREPEGGYPRMEALDEWVKLVISRYLKEHEPLDYEWLVQSGQLPESDN